MLQTKKKLLLIEDDKMIAQMYTVKLEQEGFEVVNAFDGKDGIKKAIESQPDIILLDIIMPQMDGFAVLEQLKNKIDFEKVPVIMLTNLGQELDIKRGFELGAVEYLVKANYTPSQIVEKIKTFI